MGMDEFIAVPAALVSVVQRIAINTGALTCLASRVQAIPALIGIIRLRGHQTFPRPPLLLYTNNHSSTLVYLGAVDGTAGIAPGARPVGSSLPLVQQKVVACLPTSFLSPLYSFDIPGIWRASPVLQ